MSENAPNLVMLRADGAQAATFGGRWDAAMARRGSLEELVTLAFEHHHAMVFRVANRILDDRFEAEDVTQSVFETLARHLPDVRDPARVPGFLKTCAVRRCLALRRRRSFWSRGRGALYLSPPEATEPRAHELASARQLLGRLDAHERTAVILKYVEHHSHEEVAALVGASVSTVRRRLDAARRRLRSLDDPAAARLLRELEEGE